MRSAETSPVGVYPSAIYGWARWSLACLTAPEGFPRGLLLGRPPAPLDLVVGEATHRLGVTHAVTPGTCVVHDPEDPAEWR